MNPQNFVKRNKEDIILAIGFILVLFFGFFSGYFYSQSQIKNQSVIIEEPDKNCSNLIKHKKENKCASALNSVSISNNSSSQINNKKTVNSKNSAEKKIGSFVASKNSNIYHKPNCKYVKRIKDENKIWFSSEKEAESIGYKKHKGCFE